MYSTKEREDAVKLFIQYDLSPSAVIHELGYPSRTRLYSWYKEYLETGTLGSSTPRSKYTAEQRRHAVEYYLQHGRNVGRTVKILGYPGRTALRDWINEDLPDEKRYSHCKASASLIKCSQEQKKQAVIEYCSREKTPTQISKEYGVSPNAVYRWKTQLLGEERKSTMQKRENSQSDDVAELEKRIDVLKAEEAALSEKLYQARLEYDILEKAAELLKKDQGINLKTLTNREKAILIDALREKYQLKQLLQMLNMAKSSYCYQSNSVRNSDKYAPLRAEIHVQFNAVDGRYGYRRIHAVLKKLSIFVSEKVVRRLMREEKLIVRCVKRKKYNSYAGEISPEVANIVNRDFHAKAPNGKWLTDITEFSIPAGKVYLSPMIDCFDGLVVAWSIGTSPSANLANTMLDEAISILKEGECPVIHSDRGNHYRWPGWIERIESAGLTRSMSRKGCSPDNSACEGFFGRLKNEMFYGRSWVGVSLETFMSAVNDYVRWYNEKRIKESLGWKSPMEYRNSQGLAG